MTPVVPSICVLISGNGSNLQAIIDAIATGKLEAKIACVISNRTDAYGLTRAEMAGIPAHTLDHNAFDDRENYDYALKELIDRYHPDCVVLAGFMRILTADLVNHYAGKMFNIHPSLLPKYKGLHTHKQAIENGDTEHGVSVHFVTPELDGGPVVIQSRVPVFEDDSEVELAARVQEQERQIYPLVLQWFCSGRLVMHENNAIMDGQRLPLSGYASE
ncbi:phosphoribosylglycinamide formyltransferase [Alteromonas sp. ASW11-130]|uniref:phosphoribosylglycinamide formyltransferase n=1 Tax=Alteromonas sp. ASW11-130 TaxID=3015775 RepID=UPI00224250D9|nr:phosphoribosylglycinamide formyltransferase [Alteromonas sp. ASW11-130]MCW8092429.1 phosphoribosylglycinamide formyltransferase [Alteromonas sp. ASW11-130]